MATKTPPVTASPISTQAVASKDQRGTPTLFHTIVSMMAVVEGGIISPSDPEFGPAVNDALYGIVINGTQRLVYDKEVGLDLVNIVPL